MLCIVLLQLILTWYNVYTLEMPQMHLSIVPADCPISICCRYCVQWHLCVNSLFDVCENIKFLCLLFESLWHVNWLQMVLIMDTNCIFTDADKIYNDFKFDRKPCTNWNIQKYFRLWFQWIVIPVCKKWLLSSLLSSFPRMNFSWCNRWLSYIRHFFTPKWWER